VGKGRDLATTVAALARRRLVPRPPPRYYWLLAAAAASLLSPACCRRPSSPAPADRCRGERGDGTWVPHVSGSHNIYFFYE
jgi:hypothetical protein